MLSTKGLGSIGVKMIAHLHIGSHNVGIKLGSLLKLV